MEEPSTRMVYLRLNLAWSATHELQNMVAKPAARWYKPLMDKQAPPSVPKTPVAGGFFMFLGAIAGAFIGGYMGQPVIGLLTGFAAGAAGAAAVWFFDRRRD